MKKRKTIKCCRNIFWIYVNKTIKKTSTNSNAKSGRGFNQPKTIT